MVCDTDNQFNLSGVNWSHPGNHNPEDLIHYPGDSLTIDGEFSIHGSPWAISAKTTYAGGSTIADAEYQFNNVIVDWGDGQWTQLKSSAVNSSLPGWSNADRMYFNETHRYTYPGDFSIRIYVVPQDQMGNIDAIVAGHSSLPQLGSPDTPPDGAGKPKFQLAGAQISEDPGSRIFMLYCNPMEVTIIQDTAATGPLNLETIEISSFSSDATGDLALVGRKLKKQGSIRNLKTKGTQKVSLSSQPEISLNNTQAQITSFGEDTRVSSCNGGLWAKGTLHYFGQGYARVQWLVDGVVIDSREIKIGPSQLRKNLTNSDPASWGEPLLSDFVLESPRLPVNDLSLHSVQLSAVVIPDPTWSMVNSVSLRSTLLQQQGSKQKGKQAPSALTPLGEKPGKGMQPEFIPITTNKTSGKTWSITPGALTRSLSKVPDHKSGRALFQPPYSVISAEKRYLVTKNSSDHLCQMSFPTQSGLFIITGLKNLHSQNSVFSGTGLLIYKLADGGPGSSREHYIPIRFKQWQVSDDAIVKHGTLQVDADTEIDTLPGMKAVLKQIAGEAGQFISATMNVTVKDTTLRLAGTEVPQQWKGVSAPLTAAGDWYASGFKLGRSRIGWSMTSIESDDVRIDLSHSEGNAPSCGYGGANWVGIHLGTATFHPYVFDLADIPIPASNWGIGSTGLCGKAESGNFSHTFGQGKIGWKKLTINALQGNLYTRYNGFYVDIEWPKIHLESSKTSFNYSPGSQVDVQLGFEVPPAVTEHYDNIDMKVMAKSFSHTESGWGLLADTELTFRDRQGKLFADKVVANDIFFSINNFAEYRGGVIPLDIKGQVGGADQLISAVTLTTGGNHSNKKILFDFTTEFSLEGMGRAKEPVHILYGIEKKNHQSAFSTEPQVPAVIVLESQFPETNSATSSTFSIGYGSSSTTTASGSGGCGHDTFGGHINTQMFGSTTAIEGTFRFGTLNNSRYWLGFLKGDNLSIPVYADVYIEMIQGGLAYNFDHDAFNHDGGYTACPSPGKGLLFSAGLGLSVGGNDVIRADGILTIQPSDSFYQLEGHALLFNSADLYGRLRYWQSAFDGEIWGTASLLGDQIRIVAPEHSCGIHIDSATWKFFMGTKDNPVTGHLTSLVDGYTYLTLGNENGFLVGAGVDYKYGDTYNGFGFRGTLSVSGEISLTTSPLRFDGQINGDVSGDFINPVKDISVSVNSHAWVGCCNPTKFGFGFSASCCCAKGGVDIYVLPSSNISGWAKCTCCDPRDWF